MKPLGEEQKSNATLVDEYIRNLENLGISLKDLGLLGDIDYKNGDGKLTEKELIEKILTDSAYSEQKVTVEKYIKEFIKADLITQSIHKRRGTELINEDNDDWIDGGVYLYRTKQVTDTSGALQIDNDGNEYIKEIGSEEYVQMQYVTPEEWQELISRQDKKIRYRYTLDEEGNVVIAKVKTVETIEGDISNSINTWFENVQNWINERFGIGADSTQVIIEGEEHIDYKAYISKYTMPYEFLVSLCEITGSPEFVYHVAMLARKTKIELAVQDDTTIDKVVTETKEKYEGYENHSNNSTSGATKTSEDTKKRRKVVITTTTDPHLEIELANTWSFYEEYKYTKNIEENIEENGPITQQVSRPGTLRNHQEAGTRTEISYEGVEIEVEIPEKWYDTFLVEKTTYTKTTTTTTTYNPGVLANSVEKSKQFLGLLRNENGKCYYNDCYENPTSAKYCSENAEFDRSGINVTYERPNSTNDRKMPLNELLNKADMLYSILGENVEGDETANAEEDSVSQYKVKMQGLIDHMKYLMTFPENEDLEDDTELIDRPIDEDEYEDLNVDDLIVKTDETGALRPVTEQELYGVIMAAYSGQRQSNALSILNTLISYQDTYKVNAIFVLAFADQESSIGTANSSHVRNNNWLSWNLGSRYSSPQENVEVVMQNIATGGIYFTQGKITIKDIGLTYCPNTDDYPTQGDNWVINVTSKVKRLYAMLGVNIGDGENTGGEDNSDTITIGGRTYKNYKQDSGSPWENNSFAGGTMRNSGCSITSIAIVLSGYGQNVTPEDVRQMVNGRLTDLVSVLNSYGLSTSRPERELTANEIKTHLQSNRPIIVNVEGEWTSSTGHYMVLGAYKELNGEDYVYVLNPGTVNSSKNGWVKLSRITNNMKTRSIFITSN